MPTKVDDNQAAIVRQLNQIGASVHSTVAEGNGFPDLVVGFRGQNYLFEVKSKTGKLNANQKKWHKVWQGQVHVIRCIDDALKVLGIL